MLAGSVTSSRLASTCSRPGQGGGGQNRPWMTASRCSHTVSACCQKYTRAPKIPSP
jgi:hypothetical protein